MRVFLRKLFSVTPLKVLSFRNQGNRKHKHGKSLPSFGTKWYLETIQKQFVATISFKRTDIDAHFFLGDKR